MSSTKVQPKTKYPKTFASDTSDIINGETIADPFRWLEDIDAEKTKEWIESQNELSFSYLNQLPQQAKIKNRLKELMNFKRFGVPIVRGGRYFFTANEGLQNQNVLYWMDSLDCEPQVLLDPNTLSEEGTSALSIWAVSDNGKFCVYGISQAGSDWQEWRIREVDTGKDLEDHLQWIKFSEIAWTPDNQGFYYSRFDEPNQDLQYKEINYYEKMYFHRIGTPQSEDVLIYQDLENKDYGFLGQVTDDGNYLIIGIRKGTFHENGVLYLDLNNQNQGIVKLFTDFNAGYTFIGNQGPIFYFVTDHQAPLGKVIAVDIKQPDIANWKVIIPETTDTLIQVSWLRDYFFALIMHNAHHRVAIFNLQGQLLDHLKLPGQGSVTGFFGNKKDSETFFSYSSFTTPSTVYHYDILNNVSRIFRQPSDTLAPNAFITKQVFYKSKDGTQVPMYISYKRELSLDKPNPTLLYGYGGFNISLTPNFSAHNLLWMEMGGIFALPNLRGGGEFGVQWYKAGTRENKQNVFDDFISAAQWLIDNNYTNADKLAISGRSNGGLLVGACLTQQPQLFKACLCAVGVLDMLRFHKFTIGWAWVSDYGSPDNPDDFKFLRAYSPLHNIKEHSSYPATLILTGDHDDRVFPAHSFKFAATLQAAQAANPPILIRIETNAGHGMLTPTAKIIDESTDCLAFLAQVLDL